MFFDTGYGLLRTAIAALVAYGWLVLVLRISGKRTLAKINAFDLVVTVALGSTLATAALSSEVAIAEGATAVAVLCLGQFAVAWASTRVPAVRRTVKAEPVFVVRDGRVLHEELRRVRLTEGEVRQAARQSGNGGLEQVAAMVLETDGSLSVVLRPSLGSASALADVSAFGPTGSTAAR